MDLGLPASIPQDYVSDLPTRLDVYRRLGALASQDEIASMEDELEDRFGPLPFQVQNLLYVVRLKLVAKQAGIQSISRDGARIILRLHDEVGGAGPALQKQLGRSVTVGHTQVRLELERLTDGWEQPLSKAVEKLAQFRERLGVGV